MQLHRQNMPVKSKQFPVDCFGIDGIPGHNFNSHKRSGFTLLELIFVCVIIIIVVGAVSASMAGFLSRSRLNSTAGRLASIMIFARSRAITAGRQMALEVNQAAGEIELLEQSDKDPKEFGPVGDEWKMTLPEDISMSALEIDGVAVKDGRILFFPTGGAQEAGMTLCLRAEANDGNAARKQLSINKITGRVKVE
jgi:type II secretion system protein H